VAEGVKVFRVDNPHTKPLPFWEWLIADIRRQNPEVMFLAEAFTRPAMMARLGKLGFSQSYTYFTWRNLKDELEAYFTELNQPPLRDCYRPNFFVNTPDINPTFLQTSGRPGFLIRAALATMGSGLWGMYSGFELCEGAALPGKEEYLDSEKYQIRPRDYAAPGNIVAEITQLNRIRRENPALHSHLGFKAYNAWNDNILYFGKRTPGLDNFILVAVNLDPHHAQEAHFELPLWEFGLPDEASLHGEDLMTGHRWTWHGKTQWMRIEPWHLPFGIWRIEPVT
jgi:starch synthase (maltosyl-transferring)